MIHFWSAVRHVFGLDDGTGYWYLFWSGPGSDISELAFFGAAIAVYRHHKCASCVRIARHAVEGTPYRTCHRHATLAVHGALHRRHQTDHPEQHRLLNPRRTEPASSALERTITP